MIYTSSKLWQGPTISEEGLARDEKKAEDMLILKYKKR